MIHNKCGILNVFFAFPFVFFIYFPLSLKYDPYFLVLVFFLYSFYVCQGCLHTRCHNTLIQIKMIIVMKRARSILFVHQA